jgi:regulator of replication initiation timing
MITTTEHIARIRLKLQVLLKDHHALQKENAKLKSEMARKLGIEEELREKTRQLEQQAGILKASSGQMDEASKKAFEKQLNHYIKEIDRCITMLSQ